MNITARISLMFLLLSALGFYYFAREEIGETTKRYREATEEPLVDFASVLANIVAADTLRANPQGSERPEPQCELLRTALLNLKDQRLSAKIYDLIKTSVDIRVYVTDASGKVVFDSSGRELGKNYAQWNDVSQTLQGNYGARTSRDDPDHPGSLLYVAAPIRVKGSLIGVLSVAKPNENANHFIEAAQRNTLLLGLLSFFAVAGLAVLLSLVVTRPIHALTAYVRNIRDGKKAPLPRLGSTELRTLGDAFEEMREALEGRKYVEQYVQTLTHEIKSPLTAIRGAVELLKENPPEPAKSRFMENIAREAERAEDLVKKLLSLSALQRSDQLERMETIDLPGLIEETVSSFRVQAERKSVEIHFHSEQQASVLGDRFWLGEAFTNILQNAIEFTPERSHIRVSLRQESPSVVVLIEDEGPGVPDWAIERIFEKFYSLPRPETKKRSSGLGLTIVQEVLQLHGGSVELKNREPAGAVVRISLPLA